MSGLIEIFTGNGKGKTSAALGAVLRASGHDLRIHIVHFMKGENHYGEQKALSKLPNVSYSKFGHKNFVDPDNIKPEDREQATLALQDARQAIMSGEYDVVVLDEVNLSAAWGLIKTEDVIELLEQKPDKVELILTGRGADARLIERADLVTEMVEIKHPFTRGVVARKGFDY
jgi:cob(I)alamin adenosyltransferase